MAGVSICPDCRQFMSDLLDKRIRKILEVARDEAKFQREHGNASELDELLGGSECFHLMEIKAVIEGRKTCGVYDDYGDPPTINGPLFEASA